MPWASLPTPRRGRNDCLFGKQNDVAGGDDKSNLLVGTLLLLGGGKEKCCAKKRRGTCIALAIGSCLFACSSLVSVDLQPAIMQLACASESLSPQCNNQK